MVKFIHGADIHLDSPFLGLQRYEGAPADRIIGAAREALRQLVQVAIDEEASFVIIAGDLFDGDLKDYNPVLFFRRQMSILKDAGIRVFLISGNHDAASHMSKKLGMPENVHIFSTKKPETIILQELCIAIHGQGFGRREIMENLAAHYPDAKGGFYNIGILHTCANGLEGHEPYAPCKIEELIAKGYDYWALGHIHKRKILHESPWIVFPGNIQGRHIRENGPKGCSIVTVESDGTTSVEHRCLDILRWAYCVIDATGKECVDDILDLVYSLLKKQLKESDGRMLAVRFEIIGACRSHEKLISNQDRWINEIRAVATEMSNGEAYVERILFNTSTYIDLGKLKENNNPLGHMLRFIDAIESDDALFSELVKELEPLKCKLPFELRQGEGAIDMESREKMLEILQDAQQLLVPRILAMGEDG
ncbi:MAG: metallophosphoesterase family protein [bacterium]